MVNLIEHEKECLKGSDLGLQCMCGLDMTQKRHIQTQKGDFVDSINTHIKQQNVFRRGVVLF